MTSPIPPAQIEAARTTAGGFSRKQLEEWGIKWPPYGGWKRDLELTGAPNPALNGSVQIPTYVCMKCIKPKTRSKFPKHERRTKQFTICVACLRLDRKAKTKIEKLERRSNPLKIEFANKMRAQMTRAEAHLWCALSKLSPAVLPQVVLYGYIADFYFPKQKLAIEVDGSSHNGREEYDRQRDGHLLAKGIRTIRFTNQDILADRKAALANILESL